MSLEKLEALEDRFVKLAELIRNLREDNKRLDSELQAEMLAKMELEDEMAKLKQEKEHVRERLEKILGGIESLTAQ